MSSIFSHIMIFFPFIHLPLSTALAAIDSFLAAVRSTDMGHNPIISGRLRNIRPRIVGRIPEPACRMFQQAQKFTKISLDTGKSVVIFTVTVERGVLSVLCFGALPLA